MAWSFRVVLITVAALLASVDPLGAQQPDSLELARLRAQLEAMSRDLEALRLGRDVVVRADTGLFGFGPAASKVYRVPAGVSLGGYGEFLYQNHAATRQDGTPSGATDQFDALRAILYVGYRFDERLLFNSEIEIEHGSTSGGVGEVSLEFAYIDYRLHPAFGLRAGLLLLPLGILNEWHEPPIFLGTQRPVTEQRIIPSTWRENGVGVFGSAGPLSWRAYLVNGFEAAGFSAEGLRDGRQKGAKALAGDFALAGRLDWQTLPGLALSGAGYFGRSGQGLASATTPGATIGARTAIAEAHAVFQRSGFDIRALGAVAWVEDAAALNATLGFAGPQSIGERLTGWYVQGGYDVLRGHRTVHRLLPYARYERVNTQARVPAGFTANPANDLSVLAIGLAWKPRTSVVVKADYQIHRNEADTGVNQFAASLGYLF